MRIALPKLATACIAVVTAVVMIACDRGDLGDAPIERCFPDGACDAAMFQTGIKASLGDKVRGAPLFATHCARCHGAEGLGLGESAAIDMTSAAWQASVRDATIVKTMRTGRGAQMPSFTLTVQELRDILAHLRSLVRAPVAPAAPKGY